MSIAAETEVEITTRSLMSLKLFMDTTETDFLSA